MGTYGVLAIAAFTLVVVAVLTLAPRAGALARRGQPRNGNAHDEQPATGGTPPSARTARAAIAGPALRYRLARRLAETREAFGCTEICLWQVTPETASFAPFAFDAPDSRDPNRPMLTADPQRLVAFRARIETGEPFVLDACDGGLAVVPVMSHADVPIAVLVAAPTTTPTHGDLSRLGAEAELLATLMALDEADGSLRDLRGMNDALLEANAEALVVMDRLGHVLTVRAGAGNPWPTGSGITTPQRGDNFFEWCRRLTDAGYADAPVLAAALDAMATGAITTWQHELGRDRPPRDRWYHVSASRVAQPDPRLVVMWRDVTERRQADANLRERERYFRFMLDAVPAMIWLADTGRRCTYFNRAWLDFTGRTMEQETGDGWMTAVHPEDAAHCLDVYSRAFAVAEPFTLDYRLRRRDGRYRWVNESGVPWTADDGSVAGFVGSAIDITERRQSEDVARELSGRLIVAQEAERRRIAREVHDDLSQRVALLVIELEQLGSDLPEARRIARSAAEVSSDLHRLSHRLHPARLEATGLVASIQGFCHELWSQHSLQVQFVHQGVPARVPTDVSLSLYRIVQEALLNVIKHSGTKKADVELIGRDQELVLRIADPGAGFEPDDTAGVGLGLSSMRERVRSLGGDFVVHTAPGRGTRIGVRVPAEPPIHEKQTA